MSEFKFKVGDKVRPNCRKGYMYGAADMKIGEIRSLPQAQISGYTVYEEQTGNTWYIEECDLDLVKRRTKFEIGDRVVTTCYKSYMGGAEFPTRGIVKDTNCGGSMNIRIQSEDSSRSWYLNEDDLELIDTVKATAKTPAPTPLKVKSFKSPFKKLLLL